MRKKNLKIDYVQLEEAINMAWISAEDLMKIYPFSRGASYRAFSEIASEMDKEGAGRFKERPRLIPTRRFLEKKNIDVDFVREQASKIRKNKIEELQLRKLMKEQGLN